MKEKLYLILQQLIDSEKISKNELSKATKVARKSITAYLNGVCLPRYSALAKISDYFEVSSDYLLGFEDFSGNCYKTVCPIDEIPIHFISRLKHFMTEKKLSQNKLAKLLKIKSTSVSKWFKMKTMPETQILIQLAKIFDCKVDFLIYREII